MALRLAPRFLAAARPSTFYEKDLTIKKSAKEGKLPTNLEGLVFGKTFTSHMLQVDWTKEAGWGKPTVEELHNLSLPPSCSALHYAIQCFEGLKAYKDAQGRVRLFRPDMNMKRMKNSMKRLVLPDFDEQEAVNLLKRFVVLEKNWIPSQKGYSLYLRPTGISTEPQLGVAPAGSAKWFVIASPVGPYYESGFQPVKLYADTLHVRAWKGGTGNSKVGSNYAPTVLPATEAAAKGYQQVLWLNNDVITEVGTMNFFVFWKNEQGVTELVTAPLSEGTILPGVTRDSVLALCREWSEFAVAERVFTINELVKAIEDNRVIEAFGAGTAAIVSQVSHINYQGHQYALPCPGTAKDSLALRLMDEIQSIQYGERADHPWSVLCE